MRRILFIQSVHYSNDDRVGFHQSFALSCTEHEVNFFCKEAFENNGVIEQLDYSVIIFDTPRAFFKSLKIKHVTRIYDITEWYPSKKNLRGLSIPHRCLKAVLLCLVNLWVGMRCDAFIFGEHYKAIPFRVLFPFKKFIYLPYYPDLNYFNRVERTRDISHKCKILYAGPLTKEKGFFRVLDAVIKAQKQCSDTQILLEIITESKEFVQTSEVEINFIPYLPFNDFCRKISDYDLFLDLRDNDIENSHCLPIKLFYYLACGRPSVYSNLKAIRKGVPECDSCMTLVKSSDEAANAIARYIQDKELYQSHCDNALKLSREKYNWKKIKNDFVEFVDQCDEYFSSTHMVQSSSDF